MIDYEAEFIPIATELLTEFGKVGKYRFNDESPRDPDAKPWHGSDDSVTGRAPHDRLMALLPFNTQSFGFGNSVRAYFEGNTIERGAQVCYMHPGPNGDPAHRPSLKGQIEHPDEGLLRVLAFDYFSPAGVDVLYVLGVSS